MEGYSIRQIMMQCDHSRSTLDRIVNYWLDREPPQLNIDYAAIKHIMMDGTFFNKRPHYKNNGCLILLIDSDTKKPIGWEYTTNGESYKSVFPILVRLRELGLNPLSITTDGNIHVLRAIRSVWSEIIIQRCLFHMQRQSVSWLREKPKSKEAKTLKRIVEYLSLIDKRNAMLRFIRLYELWRAKYRQKVIDQSKDSIAKKDIKKTMTLIDNAIKDMFHHITANKNIHSTTNMAESFFGHLKEHYRAHKGLTTEHRVQWLKALVRLRLRFWHTKGLQQSIEFSGSNGGVGLRLTPRNE